jgi:hypothetical protein
MHCKGARLAIDEDAFAPSCLAEQKREGVGG